MTTGTKRGIALIELVIYVGLVAALLSVIAASVITGLKFYQRTRSLNVIQSAGLAGLERIGREVRFADSISLASTFDVSPGHLILNTEAEDGSDTTVEFYLTNGRLMIKKGGAEIGPLSASAARVTNLVFRRLTGGTSEAIKIEMTVESGAGNNYQSRNWYDTIVVQN